MKPIFLVGYMAAGKTTLGRRAAQFLNIEFIDLDIYIEARYRKSVSELFAERGEAGFRDYNNISRIFKKFMGCSPIEYRQRRSAGK